MSIPSQSGWRGRPNVYLSLRYALLLLVQVIHRSLAPDFPFFFYSKFAIIFIIERVGRIEIESLSQELSLYINCCTWRQVPGPIKAALVRHFSQLVANTIINRLTKTTTVFNVILLFLLIIIIKESLSLYTQEKKNARYFPLLRLSELRDLNRPQQSVCILVDNWPTKGGSYTLHTHIPFLLVVVFLFKEKEKYKSVVFCSWVQHGRTVDVFIVLVISWSAQWNPEDVRNPMDARLAHS